MAPLVKQAVAMGKKRSATQKLAAATDENNGSSSVLLPGSTLEDYFNSKNLSDTGGLGQVSKHLLVGTPTNNAMAMEKEETADDDDVELKHTPESSSSGLAESKDGVIADEAKPESKADDQETKRHSNHDEYEDDYESDSPSPDHKSITSVAGMTLSDYLQAKETDDEDKSQVTVLATHAPINKKHEAAPKPKAVAVQPSVAAKKAAPPALISGMSLDHYLGASSAVTGSDDHDGADDSDAESSKSPTSKRKKSKTKVGAKSLATISKQTTITGTGTGEEYVTPFQKRLTKKLKAKAKQQLQPGNSNGASISKSILLAEAPTSSMSLQTKSIALNSSASPSIKDTKKKPQPQYGHLQPPLPKLVASSPSALSLLHSKDVTDGTGEDDERLPPLAHY